MYGKTTLIGAPVIQEAPNECNTYGVCLDEKKLKSTTIGSPSSLDPHKKVLTFTKKKFKFVKKIQSKEWPLPKEMYKYKKKIEFLSKKKLIFVKKKFGLILFKTDIYLVKKNG